MNRAGRVVFVVDDDVSVREALRNLLRSAGLAVRTFSTAEEFMASDRPEVPACLVLDVRLPGASGLDLQRQLSEANVRIPIVFVTAHGDREISAQARRAGAIGFLTKPFRDQELLNAVQEAFGRA